MQYARRIGAAAAAGEMYRIRISPVEPRCGSWQKSFHLPEMRVESPHRRASATGAVSRRKLSHLGSAVTSRHRHPYGERPPFLRFFCRKRHKNIAKNDGMRQKGFDISFESLIFIMVESSAGQAVVAAGEQATTERRVQ